MFFFVAVFLFALFIFSIHLSSYKSGLSEMGCFAELQPATKKTNQTEALELS